MCDVLNLIVLAAFVAILILERQSNKKSKQKEELEFAEIATEVSVKSSVV